MVTGSLRYRVREMRVDGFRFDLATILGRVTRGLDEGGGFLDSCRQDPVLSAVKLIAEPWDLGPGGYQAGGFPPGWAEWNDRFRATVRAFWKGNEGQVADLARRLTASADLCNRRGRKPCASVNLVAAHDGFTLNDVVSCNGKHNEANGADNRDGHSHNLSWNHGVDRPSEDPAIVERRERQKRNMLATLLLAQGTPMLAAGDELGVKDVTWLTPAGTEKGAAHWDDPNARCFGMLLDGRARATGIHRPASDATILIVLNADHDAVEFSLPEPPARRHWMRVLDTNRPELDEPERCEVGHPFLATGRSLLVFVLQPGRGGGGIMNAARSALLAGTPAPPLPRPEAGE